MNEAKIAVILVNYNGLNDTIECVKSILESDYTNYKIIIVDNDSSDREKIVKDTFLNENADVLTSDKNIGFSGGNNIGIRYAAEKYDSDYYLLLNNDTVVSKDAFKELVKGTIVFEKVGIVTGLINYYSKPDTAWYAGGVFNFNTGIADHPIGGMLLENGVDGCYKTTFISGCLMLIKKEVIENVGLLDEEYFLYAEDTDYCCRVMNAGYAMVYAPNAVIYHKVSASTGNQSKQQQYYTMRNGCYIIKKYCKYPIYGYARKWYRVLKDVFRGNADMKAQLWAWHEFRKGITGKIAAEK